MNLYHLRYFSTLAHIEHYTKAADILAITQPSLSYAISTLEEELGVKLFEKNGRNVTLTKYGKVFLKDVEEVLNRLDSSVNSLKLAGKGEGCALAGEGNSIYCWRDLGNLQKVLAFCGVVF